MSALNRHAARYFSYRFTSFFGKACLGVAE